MVYDDHISSYSGANSTPPQTLFTRDSQVYSRMRTFRISKPQSHAQKSLIPHVEANFEDRTQTNYSNLPVGKNNKSGLVGFLYNSPRKEMYPSVFSRINANKSVGIKDSIFAPSRIGVLLPPRSQRGRYQYSNSAPYQTIDHVIHPKSGEVSKIANPISSSAYSYNSEINFNPYVSYYSVPQGDSQQTNLGAPGSESTVSPSRTDVSFSRNATVQAFSAYDKLFGDSNYSSTSQDLQDLDASSNTSSSTNSESSEGY